MRLLLPFIFSLLSLTGSAQKEAKPVKLSTGLGIMVDYGKILTLASNFESKLEGGIDYSFGKVKITAQIGQATLEPQNAFENGTYHSKGNYIRVGAAYIVAIDATNRMYFGANYGISSYDETGTYQINSSLWDPFMDSFKRNGLKADWAAIAIGTEKKLKKSDFRVGGTFELRILNSYDEFKPVDSFAIPGYGRTQDNTVPALNVYVKYKF